MYSEKLEKENSEFNEMLQVTICSNQRDDGTKEVAG